MKAFRKRRILIENNDFISYYQISAFIQPLGIVITIAGDIIYKDFKGGRCLFNLRRGFVSVFCIYDYQKELLRPIKTQLKLQSNLSEFSYCARLPLD